ncbi:MAG: sugar ABC transporter ATP-binding protein [Clostridiaceae bacterium]|nr:sugar ABC transporter ATP-binding protein [Clostridiaceae bacterium]
MKQPIIELKGVSKIFPGVRALNSIDLDVYPGEVLGLVGENGAGKSTLIKILTGAHRNDEGKIFIEGKETVIDGPKHAMNLGITAIYQELNIVKQLTVAENVFLGREIKKGKLLDRTHMIERASELLKDLGQEINPKLPINMLGVGQQQMVEIAKALSVKTKVLIMDEPTASLSNREVKELLRTVKSLRDKGIGIVYISHRLEEILEICDRVTVMRDGEKVKTLEKKEVTTDILIKLMVGRDLEEQFPKIETKLGEEALRVEGLSKNGVFENITFGVKRGEILGLAGLVGAGRTEVMRVIFGADPKDAGDIFVHGKKVKIKSPRHAMNNKIAFLTEDRKGQGLILDNTVAFNMNISSFNKIKNGLLLSASKSKQRCAENIKKLNINPPLDNFIVRQFSGGNQQKVVIAKWLNTDADIYIFDEPTRGIDVGAKVEVYNVMNELVAKGAAIIMISSEMPEVLGMSDRIIVMHEGKITGEFNRKEANQENIMKAASGGI